MTIREKIIDETGYEPQNLRILESTTWYVICEWEIAGTTVRGEFVKCGN